MQASLLHEFFERRLERVELISCDEIIKVYLILNLWLLRLSIACKCIPLTTILESIWFDTLYPELPSIKVY